MSYTLWRRYNMLIVIWMYSHRFSTYWPKLIERLGYTENIAKATFVKVFQCLLVYLQCLNQNIFNTYWILCYRKVLGGRRCITYTIPTSHGVYFICLLFHTLIFVFSLLILKFRSRGAFMIATHSKIRRNMRRDISQVSPFLASPPHRRRILPINKLDLIAWERVLYSVVWSNIYFPNYFN